MMTISAINQMNNVGVDQNLQREQKLPGDHIALKVLCCIPIIGVIFSTAIASSLKYKVRNLDNWPIPLTIRLVDLTKQYLKISIYHDVLLQGFATAIFATTVAVALVASEIILPAIIFGALIALVSFDIRRKVQHIRALNQFKMNLLK